MPIEITLTNEQKVRIFANPTTVSGKSAQLDGPIRATMISGEGSAQPGNNDLEVVLLSGDNPGDSTFLIDADADLGEGVVLVQDTVTLHVQGAMAASLGLSPGTPELK